MEARYIERRERGTDFYHHLEQRSVALLQRLSGEIWSDYNVHDPGVTLLEVLNHALDELRYKLDFPLDDYLTDPASGKIPFRRMGLLPFDELLRRSVVTTGDYERLMVERLPEVAACRGVFSGGYYDFTLYLSGGCACREAGDDEGLVRRAARLYHTNRNLCETLGEVRIGQGPPPKAPSRTKESLDGMPQQALDHRPPRHTHRDIASYRSVAADLPRCYDGNPQLEAYLLIFDHLLAGAAEQAAATRDLLDIHAEPTPEEWLDALNTLYGENTREAQRSLAERTRLIVELPEMNRLRFRSFDIHEPPSPAEHRIVEHLLLYSRGEAPEEELGRLSLVAPSWVDAEERVRERFPAHIATTIRLLPPAEWLRFEKLYRDWRAALAGGNAEEIKTTSREIKNSII